MPSQPSPLDTTDKRLVQAAQISVLLFFSVRAIHTFTEAPSLRHKEKLPYQRPWYPSEPEAPPQGRFQRPPRHRPNGAIECCDHRRPGCPCKALGSQGKQPEETDVCLPRPAEKGVACGFHRRQEATVPSGTPRASTMGTLCLCPLARVQAGEEPKRRDRSAKSPRCLRETSNGRA